MAKIGEPSTFQDLINLIKSKLGTAAYKDIPSSGNATSTEVVMGDDTRLTDSRTPTSHTHTVSDISNFPTLGTAAALNVATSGNASTTEVVKGDDTRLTDSRTPTSHTHTVSDISNFPTLGTAAALNVAESGNASTSEVVKGDDTRLSDARNAADVYSWAKASSKPSYDYSEINNTPTIPDVSTCMIKGTDYVTAGKKANTTLGDYATAEGYNNTASGSYSHAEGYNCTASNNYAHAQGSSCTASGSCSYASGNSTIASGSYSSTYGQNSKATAKCSFAEGNNTTAGHEASHSEGKDTQTGNSFQHVQGKYNVGKSTTAFEIGNGSSTSNRSNAVEVDWSGNATFAGDVTDGSGNVLSNKLNTASLPIVQVFKPENGWEAKTFTMEAGQIYLIVGFEIGLNGYRGGLWIASYSTVNNENLGIVTKLHGVAETESHIEVTASGNILTLGAGWTNVWTIYKLVNNM